MCVLPLCAHADPNNKRRKEKPVHTLLAGDCLGELGMLLNQVRRLFCAV